MDFVNHSNTQQIISNLSNKEIVLPFENMDPTEYSLKISRHFLSLLEDYRYLMTCFIETCSCHANFDYQFFFKKLEERYDKLSNLVSSNDRISQIINENEETSLEQLIDIITPNVELENPDKCIPRVRICERPKRPLEDQDKEIGENEEDEEMEFMDLPKIDMAMKGTKVAYKCTFPSCDFLSFTHEELLEHIKIHTIGDNVIKVNEIEKRDVLYVCQQCGKEFAGQKWLENHVENVHTYTKTYSCDYLGCTYSSKFRCVMEDHRRRHSKTKEFKCFWEGCESEFVTRRDMTAHVNFFHKGIKNYFCTWPNCEASFKDSNRLKHHLYTHTGERPYKCDYPGCEASFKQTPHLHKHKKIHSINGKQEQLSIDSRPSQEQLSPSSNSNDSSNFIDCPRDGCQKKFPSTEEMQKHLKMEHTDEEETWYSCLMDGCEQVLPSKEDLEEHLREKHCIAIDKPIKVEMI